MVVATSSGRTDSSKPLDGKVAWVTGGASGIGLAIVDRLRSLGASVAVLDIHRPDSLSDSQSIQLCNITERASVDEVSARLESLLGPPHILVNCAGIAGGSMLADHDPTLWDRIIAVNLTGTFNIVRKVFRMMATSGSGRIVLFTSDAAFMSDAGLGAYAASKAGVTAFGRAVATEGGPLGISCNMISPGLVDTPMARAHFGSQEAFRSAAAAGNVLGVVLEPEDLAATAAFLCLPESRYITGQVLHVNAGNIMR
jgi:2-hydroxycyclohexanecarboxyl-CoA dehydrogenase